MKELLKIPIGKYFNYHQTGEKNDIFLFGTRRSGTTLLMEVIYSQPGIKYCNQPFRGRWNPHKSRLLPKFPQHKLVTLDQKEKRLVRNYFQKIINNEIQVSPPWRFLSDDYNFKTDRYLLKICNAHALMEWFEKEFDAKIVYLLRHPVPVALSIQKRNWQNKAKAYLNDDVFLENYLNDDQTQYANSILDEGSQMERYVLEWALENLVPLNSDRKENWLVITYEELLLNPKPIINLLAERLNLPQKDKMLSKIFRPSNTAQKESRTKIKKLPPPLL